MKLVAAFIFMCNTQNVCNKIHLEIDPTACNFKHTNARIINDGTPIDVTVGITCEKQTGSKPNSSHK